MGFAAGITAGRASAPNWDAAISRPGNPYAIASSLMRPGPGPTVIRDKAAELALKQKELDLRAREAALQEQKLKQDYEIAQRQAAVGEQNAATNAMEAKNRTAQLANANQVNQGTLALNERKQGFEEAKAARQNAFNMARWGVATNNSQAVMDYINQYGDPKANIESLEFGPDGKDVLVKFSGQDKPVYFKSKDEFYRGFLALTDPRVERSMLELAAKKEAAKTKKKTTNPYKVTVAQAAKEYDKRWLDMAGEPKPDAPDRETWINDYVRKHAQMGGQAAQGEKKATVVTEKRSRDGSGNKLREWSDGTKEVVNPKGEVLYVMSPDGVRYSRDDKDKQNQLGYHRYLKTNSPSGMNLGRKKALPAPGESSESPARDTGKRTPGGGKLYAGAIPKKAKNVTPKEEKKGGSETNKTEGGRGYAEYVDPKTGDKVRVTIENGKVVRKVVKKKRKKEKGSGNSSGD